MVQEGKTNKKETEVNRTEPSGPGDVLHLYEIQRKLKPSWNVASFGHHTIHGINKIIFIFFLLYAAKVEC